ncbi:MAG: hypothetical protein HY363_04035 [Candidatus Aenigmarchaeota archaeon]|nr:hypothetical protein [Candidatus Aenigmarchaeota archaeon]
MGILNYIKDTLTKYQHAKEIAERVKQKTFALSESAGRLEEKILELQMQKDECRREYTAVRRQLDRYNSLEQEVKNARAGNEKINEELKNMEGKSLVERVFGAVAETAPYAAFFLGWLFNDKYSLSKAAEKLEPEHPELSYLAAEKIEDAEAKQKYIDKTVEKRSGLWSWLFYKVAGNKLGELKSAVKLAEEHPFIAYAAAMFA